MTGLKRQICSRVAAVSWKCKLGINHHSVGWARGQAKFIDLKLCVTLFVCFVAQLVKLDQADIQSDRDTKVWGVDAIP